MKLRICAWGLALMIGGIVARAADAQQVESTSPRPPNINLGCLVRGFLAASDGFALEQLKLDVEQLSLLESMAIGFGKTDEYSQFEDLVRPWRTDDWEVERYFRDGFLKNSGFVDTFNDAILKQIDDVLNAKQRRRFRDIYTQNMLRHSEFDGVMKLHRIRPNLTQYKQLREKQLELFESDAVPSIPLLEYRAGLKVMSEYLNQEELDTAAGEEFSGALRENKSEGPTRFDSSPMVLLTLPRVQKELNLKVGQLRELHTTVKSLSKLYNSQNELNITATASSAKDVDKEMAMWNSEVRKSISGILTDTQQSRLNQLVFQRHVRGLSPSKALQAAGKPYDPQVGRGDAWNFVQAEAFYQAQVNELLVGLEVLGVVVGERETSQLCGKIALSPSPWRFIDPKVDEAIRQRVSRPLLGLDKRPPTNPRRVR